MKNITNRLVLLAAVSAMFTACGGDAASLDEKKQVLEEKREELLTLKAEIEKLETEIASETDTDTKAGLKRVTSVTVAEGTFAHYVDVPGEVTSDNNVLVAPETSGVLVKKYVKEGQFVRKGQTVATLDVEVMRKQLNEVETSLDLARTLYEKQERLWKQNIGSEVQYLQAKNNVSSLEAKEASLKSQIRKGVVTAPISGTVDEFFANAGEMAAAGQPLTRIVNLGTVEINAEVSEVYSGTIKKGDKVLVTFPMLNLEKELTVDMVGQYINDVNRTFKIRMRMDNSKDNLKPNTMAMVRIKDFEKAESISVPTHLVQNTPNGKQFMYVIKSANGKDVVEKVEVETGKSYNGMTLVTKGLNKGSILVDKGYSEVINGEEVYIVADNS
ncbi:efflux RND transporter periplasmic adaptor subunit [Limibacter armeniacum]|uniref:efflux RND transporter periplasmic adaptor subunit n=1 Tax=Limibacter armeniacum TaxID=466084 RepID=UPI002FE51EB6